MAQKNEDFDAVIKELAAEIAAINAGNPNREDLVRELAMTKLLLRYAEKIEEQTEKAFAALEKVIHSAEKGVSHLEAERQRNETLKEQQSKLISLLPKVFEEGKKSLAKAGAHSAHAENRKMKQEVFEWLDANPPKPRGKSAAATVISEKIAPVVFTTALKWVNDWEKLRSTSTP